MPKIHNRRIFVNEKGISDVDNVTYHCIHMDI